MSIPLAQFYGILATTASIFVGILTAYLVNKMSELESRRGKLLTDIKSIDEEIEQLKNRISFKVNLLEETEEEWKIEQAENDVDYFIDYVVGDDWRPSSDEITQDSALEALVEHRDLDDDEVYQHHVELIDQRWDEIRTELSQTSPLYSGMNVASDSNIQVIKALWKIYEKEKYDRTDTSTLKLEKEFDKLFDEREVIQDEIESLDPQQLKSNISITLIPIITSVVIPIVFAAIHMLGWTITGPPYLNTIEILVVVTLWFVGFVLSLGYIWYQIEQAEIQIPEPPVQQDNLYEDN